jgi:hypothetical protein
VEGANRMKKIVILGIICLFVGMGFQPALAIEPKLSAENIENVEDCDCQETDRLNSYLVKYMITRLEIATNILLSKFGYIPEVKEKCQEVLEGINSIDIKGIIQEICDTLFGLSVMCSDMIKYFLNFAEDYTHFPPVFILFTFLAGINYLMLFPILFVGLLLNCDWIYESFTLERETSLNLLTFQQN